MRGELVVDASVAAKLFVTEVGSDAVRALADSDVGFIAPDFVLVELANVAVKRLRRGDITRDLAEHMVATAHAVFRELTPAASLGTLAFQLATDHGLSTYDAHYAALAEARKRPLATADMRLFERLARSNLEIETWTP